MPNYDWKMPEMRKRDNGWETIKKSAEQVLEDALNVQGKVERAQVQGGLSESTLALFGEIQELTDSVTNLTKRVRRNEEYFSNDEETIQKLRETTRKLYESLPEDIKFEK